MKPFSQFDTHDRLRHLITLDGMSGEQLLKSRRDKYLGMGRNL